MVVHTMAAKSSSVYSTFAVSTSDAASSDECDRSLFYSYATSSRARTNINTFKGLSLAVRGVLDSICGEKVRVCVRGGVMRGRQKVVKGRAWGEGMQLAEPLR